jgi:Na+-transporting NADH:ubiquinone oxidoreductase subunit NqrE
MCMFLAVSSRIETAFGLGVAVFLPRHCCIPHRLSTRQSI